MSVYIGEGRCPICQRVAFLDGPPPSERIRKHWHPGPWDRDEWPSFCDGSGKRPVRGSVEYPTVAFLDQPD